MPDESQTPHPSHIVRRINITGGRENAQPYILDIFPHRLHPASGFTREDMVLTLIAMLDGVSMRSFYGTHDLNALTHQSLEHPYGRFEQGSILCTPGTDETAQQVHIKAGHHIELWDGRRFDLGAFAPTPFGPNEARNQQSQMRGELMDITGDPIRAIVIGMVDEMLPIAYDKDIHQGPLEICLQVAARAARLVQSRQGAAGVAGAHSSLEGSARLLRALDAHWICPPDRGWCPDQRLKSPLWDEVRGAMNHTLVSAGREIAQSLQDLEPGIITNHAAIHGDDKDLSNHQRLEVKRVIKRLDLTIEDTVPVSFLKPAAAKRRLKRAG